MKYTSIINSLFGLLTVVFFSTNVNGQDLTNSPYSYYGLGETGGLDHATILGAGNTTTTFFDSTIVNFYNPASYNQLVKGEPLFSTGISSRISTFQQGSSSYSSHITSMNHFVMAFPVKNHFGFALGLKPYSKRGYSFTTADVIDGDSIIYNYDGSGGFNEAFLGLSSDVLKLRSTRLSFGANLGYLFGESGLSRSSSLNNSSNIGINERYLRMKSFHYELGMYYSQFLDSNQTHLLTLAATIEPSQNLNVSYEDGLYYRLYSSTSLTYFYDTLSYSSEKGSISTASNLNLGLSYKISLAPNKDNSRRLNSTIAFHANYGISNWSLYKGINDSTSYSNTSKLNFGIEFIPQVTLLGNSAIKPKFYEKLRYRAGYYNYSLPYLNNGVKITDRGYTLGVGIPVIIQRSTSSINFGVAFGNRGTGNDSNLTESYYGINFGITIAPGFNEKWFRKTKYN